MIQKSEVNIGENCRQTLPFYGWLHEKHWNKYTIKLKFSKHSLRPGSKRVFPILIDIASVNETRPVTPRSKPQTRDDVLAVLVVNFDAKPYKPLKHQTLESCFHGLPLHGDTGSTLKATHYSETHTYNSIVNTKLCSSDWVSFYTIR